MTNVSRKGVWAIVLGTLAVATLIFFAWATSGFRNWDAASWFNYWWGLNKPAVTRITEPPAEQHATALTSADDIDHTFVHDSDEVNTTFAVTRARSPQVYIETPDSSTLTYVAACGTRVCISVRDPHGVDDVYTSGTVKVYIGYDDFGPGVHLQPYYFTVTPENQKFYLESDELDKIFKNLRESDSDYIKSRNKLQIYAGLSDVPGYQNSLMSNQVVTSSGSWISSTYFIYDISNEKADFNYSGSTVTIPLNPDFVSQNAYSVCVSSVNSERKTTILAEESLYSPQSNKGNAITLVDNSFVVDLSKISFFENPTSTDSTYIRLRINPESLGAQALYGKGWQDSYFEISKLPAPTNLTYNAGTLTWNAVSGANRYGVFWTDINGNEQHVVVSEPTYTFDLNKLSSGEHTVRVRALGNIGESIADSETSTMRLTAYNASTTVTQLVALTYNVNGDTVIKFVPYGKNVADYCYDVSIPNKEFGGWYYDDGFSRKVEPADVLSGDTIIYARLSDKIVVEHNPTWWDLHKWQVLIPCFVVVGLGVVVAVIIGIRKRKAA